MCFEYFGVFGRKNTLRYGLICGGFPVVGVSGYLIFLIIFTIKALIKYVKSKDIKKEKSLIKKSLGEVLKQHREECKMTQEFVAEAIGVSRQAVSKWENGTSDPNTSNLIVLSKLFKISPEELLDEIQ